MLTRRTAGLLAVLACLAAPPAAIAAGPADVTVRVEGQDATLLEPTTVRTRVEPVNKTGQPGQTCTGTSVAGALEVATGGDWGGQWFDGIGYSVERIFGETHAFKNNSDFWGEWVNHKAGTGLCSDELQQGDEVLFFVDHCTWDGKQCADPVSPVEVTAPSAVQRGNSAEVSVVAFDAAGRTRPAADARVTGPGVDAKTGSDGRATVVFGEAGDIRLKADGPAYARSAARVVHVTEEAAPAPAPGGGGESPAAAPDRTAPVTRIAGIRDGRRYARRRAPRLLRGSVTPDPSGLLMVKLSLTRSRGGHCAIYSPTRERFRGAHCGRRIYFSIGDREQWSYLLPRRLGRGRYVFDAVAIDKAGNRDRVVRGRSRVVFTVR